MIQTFSGLSNQGATCYMNSLLQTLYMTPEFVRRLFQWQHTQSSKHDCIPFQLQLLFAKLLLKDLPFYDTTGLTRSFQWDIRETLQQHDVQQFCRVLFDAIQESVKGTQQEKMIIQLYQGSYYDYVRCLRCNQLNSKQDKFLDLALTVKDQISGTHYDSVQESLKTYLKPEYLTGDNKYFCENCSELTDAVKGLKFDKLPYILVLQLKRFDLDYMTLQRRKLNDKVSFPNLLDMNQFANSESQSEEEDCESVVAVYEYCRVPEFGWPEGVNSMNLCIHQTAGYESIIPDKQKSGLKPDAVVINKINQQNALIRKKQLQEKAKICLQNGPEVFELFSVMVHSGSALGGHYFAYIKSFQTNRWYCFNDTQVQEIDEEQIAKAYGGSVESWSGNYSTNAYLLMYRKVTENNLNFVNQQEIPVYLLNEIAEQRVKKEKQLQELQQKRMQVHIKVYYQNQFRIFSIRRDKPLSSLLEAVVTEFGFGSLNSKNIRLRSYNPSKDIFLETYTAQEHFSLEFLQINTAKPMVLERKNSFQVFQEYDSSQMTIKVNIWEDWMAEHQEMTLDMKTKTPKRILVQRRAQLRDLLQVIQSQTGIPSESQLLFKKHIIPTNHSLIQIQTEEKFNELLMYSKIFEGTVLFLEEKKDFSKWRKEAEKNSYRVNLYYNYPENQDYSNVIVIDKREILKNFKQKLAVLIDLEFNQFILKRINRRGLEIKNLQVSIEQSSLKPGQIIHIQKGRPCKPDQISLQIFLAQPPLLSKDSTTFKFYKLMDYPCSLSKKISELKSELLFQLFTLFPSININPDHMVLREKIGKRLSKVLKDWKCLQDYRLFEYHHIAFQQNYDLLEVPENCIVAMIRVWRPSTWELTNIKEVLVPKFSKLSELAEVLSDSSGIPQLQIDICSITYLNHFTRSDLMKEKWVRVSQYNTPLTGAPLYVQGESPLLIVKDCTESLREMTDGELSQFMNERKSSDSFNYRENGVKITVKKNLDINQRLKQLQSSEGVCLDFWRRVVNLRKRLYFSKQETVFLINNFLLQEKENYVKEFRVI